MRTSENKQRNCKSPRNEKNLKKSIGRYKSRENSWFRTAESPGITRNHWNYRESLRFIFYFVCFSTFWWSNLDFERRKHDVIWAIWKRVLLTAWSTRTPLCFVLTIVEKILPQIWLTRSFFLSTNQILARVFSISLSTKHSAVRTNQGVCRDLLSYGLNNIMFCSFNSGENEEKTTHSEPPWDSECFWSPEKKNVTYFLHHVLLLDKTRH
jgi:hypothetical protein